MSPDPASPAPVSVDASMLEDYLNQHLLGSRPGVPAFRAAADTWKGTAQEPVLRALADEVEQNQRALVDLIRRLGFTVSATTRSVGALAVVAGRLNPVNAWRSRTSGWTQVQLDTLVGALAAQAEMWRVLVLAAPHVPGLEASEAERLLARVEDQIERLRGVTDQTLPGRLLRR